MANRAWIAAPLALLSIGMIYLHGVRAAVFYDGVCGDQMHPLIGELHYDEWGIVEQWTRAHAEPCKRVWVKGVFETNETGYWPELHHRVAAGVAFPDLQRAIGQASDAAVRRKDKLGRTLMHWAAIYPRTQDRDALIALLQSRGLGLEDKDSDGLTPLDWRRQYDSSSGKHAP